MPKVFDLGLTVPDPNLRYDKATDRWHYTEPDWEEFKKVVRGGGPMSQARVETRRLAHEDGRWVREALTAAAAKRAIPLPPAS
jgi:ring-1,2-phenylacetyl-CoA epoxidase subunit PaaA